MDSRKRQENWCRNRPERSNERKAIQLLRSGWLKKEQQAAAQNPHPMHRFSSTTYS